MRLIKSWAAVHFPVAFVCDALEPKASLYAYLPDGQQGAEMTSLFVLLPLNKLNQKAIMSFFKLYFVMHHAGHRPTTIAVLLLWLLFIDFWDSKSRKTIHLFFFPKAICSHKMNFYQTNNHIKTHTHTHRETLQEIITQPFENYRPMRALIVSCWRKTHYTSIPEM